MRQLINLLIIIFVIGTVYYEVKSNNFPDVSKYFDQIGGEFSTLKDEWGRLTGNSTPGSNTQTPEPAATTQTPIPQQSQKVPLAKIVLPGPLSKIDATTAQNPLTVSGIIVNTNIQRKSHSVAVVTESAKLDASAKVKAEDILKRQYFEHTAPDGKTVSDLVINQGYTYIKIGENLALGNFKDDADVVTAWMNSPGHRANILDAAYTEMGVGVAYGMYQGRLVSVAVQHFGRPRSTCPSIDNSLRVQVESGQKELDTLASSLNSLKTEIDEGRAQGNDMSATIIIYNNGIDKYQAEYSRIDALRLTYNAEINDFNKCVAAVK